uniref:Uncharacterized protein n=1 Tax=Tetraselmis chuii TaxID=63592 RepID=A0A7S1SGI3_9CHLO|mmetsp:Transcript_10570/g.19153  ORF Transcript_10570/g.19153 Transcript_10570/m.19153 type:complete len:238 (+) Transcript_10570:110-823(+)
MKRGREVCPHAAEVAPIVSSQAAGKSGCCRPRNSPSLPAEKTSALASKGSGGNTMKGFGRMVRGLLGTEDTPGNKTEQWALVAEYATSESGHLRRLKENPKRGLKEGSNLKLDIISDGVDSDHKRILEVILGGLIDVNPFLHFAMNNCGVRSSNDAQRLFGILMDGLWKGESGHGGTVTQFFQPDKKSFTPTAEFLKMNEQKKLVFLPQYSARPCHREGRVGQGKPAALQPSLLLGA